ncbi:PREDICTED: multidrug resistance-associated protein 1-like [Acropora digitifera]|uniref:multidrug resistance-associated protein 1-like n=1 Tax=Acropora digitifera TaxID=70779 RepID=UPI00077A1EC3|nr:PREDICTED: multidrug resistance-associated protein 1-like [Acropora digitifera]
MTEETLKVLKVVAVSVHDPHHVDDSEHDDAALTAPDIASQLPVKTGDTFEVFGRDVNWWLYVKHLESEKKGYIPSTCVVPMKEDAANEEKEELVNNMEPSTDWAANLKMFPEVPEEEEGVDRAQCPEEKANIFSKLTFWWLNGLIFKGFKNPLVDGDLWALGKSNRSVTIVPKFMEKWAREEKRCAIGKHCPVEEQCQLEQVKLKEEENDVHADTEFLPKKDEKQKDEKKEKKASLLRTIVYLFGRQFLLAMVLKVINDIIQFAQPQLLNLLISYTRDRSNPDDKWKGYVYAIAMFLVAMTISLVIHQYFQIVFVLGMKIRTAIIGMVYAKALALNNRSRNESTAGEMVNLMAVDAQRLMDLTTYINVLWSSPLTIIIALYFLYDTMGPAVFAGVGVLVLLIPFNMVVSRIARKLQVKQMEAKDKRIKLVNEIFSGIKVLKLYAWEESFMSQVMKIRAKELHQLKNAAYLNASFAFTFTCAPFMVEKLKICRVAGSSICMKLGNQLGRVLYCQLVRFAVFWAYAKSVKVYLAVALVLFIVLAEIASVFSGIWLASWSASNVTTSAERDRYLGGYAGLGVTQAFCVLMSSLCLALGSKIASRHLHRSILVNVMHLPMSFFESTPLGRIVNRFSKDISTIDDKVPMSLASFLRTFCTVVGTIIAISFATPMFLVVIIPLGALYFFIQRIYVATSRQLKRIESVSRSPIFNNFFETINGASTIRAFGQQDRLIQDNYHRVDENHVAYFPGVTANRWLALRLEFVGNLAILFAAIFAVIRRDSIDSGLVGLSITYALQVTASLNWMVRMSSELETNIVSVERVKEYAETTTEADWIVPDNRPPDDWPDQGSIVMSDFDLRYREGLPLVLKQINCDIKPGEKIGIVGRTGAGKSTLTLALFRILERAGGKILIDGIDISKLGLQDLRSRLTIIPQDPVLFSGTLRLNLDPFDSHTDEELWGILELSHLKNFVSGLEQGLLYPVTEEGGNLSVGQRQLVCLARALLRKSKVLVLDEATAAVDLETDELIQQTIRREFSDRTIFTIAHRLNTIMDYTRVMVLDNGSIIEFDSPNSLIARRGQFYSMVRDARINFTSVNPD